MMGGTEGCIGKCAFCNDPATGMYKMPDGSMKRCCKKHKPSKVGG